MGALGTEGGRDFSLPTSAKLAWWSQT